MKRINLLKTGLNFFVNDTSLYHKLVFSFIVLTAVPLFIFNNLSYKKSAEMVTDNMIMISNQTLYQTLSAINESLSKIVDASNLITFNETLGVMLKKNYAGHENKFNQMKELSQVRELISNIKLNSDVVGIKIYAKDNFGFNYENINFYDYSTIENTKLLNDAIEQNGKLVWSKAYEENYKDMSGTFNVVSCTRIVKGYSVYGDIIGLVTAELDITPIQKILRDNAVEGSIMIIVDEKMDSVFKDTDYVFSDLQFSNEWENISYNGKQYLSCIKPIKTNDWNLIYMIPEDKILNNSKILRNYNWLLIVFLSFISISLAFIVSKTITRRLKNLLSSIEHAKGGEIETVVLVEGTDEIGAIQSEFQEMLKTINSLMDEQYRLGLKLKTSEIKALQAQINPHFLYNTLQLVNWKTNQNNMEQIREILSCLGKFYKLGLSKGKITTTIKEELEHAKAYFTIQNIRFNHAILLELEVDEEIEKAQILRVIIQPLVENSLVHGILEKDPPTGVILISILQEENSIHVSISDDGIGIDKDKCLDVEKEINLSQNKYFGLTNVNKRLKMFYGETAGLKITTKSGEGTIVSFTFPYTIEP